MYILARVSSSNESHEVELQAGERRHSIAIPAKPNGPGSDVNGGELLFLALATCYCNDLYREAAKQGIIVDRVDVTVEGEFGGAGEPAKSIRYRAHAQSQTHPDRLRDLLLHTDTVTEIQKTLRSGCPISFEAG
jgi:organic hydroperoxide reductase OsmC/OhrA